MLRFLKFNKFETSNNCSPRRSGHHMLGSLHSLLEGFVEACTFHAWSLLL